MGQGPEKPEKGTAPSVAIDGARIRSVRETKKLTQLYVASVVGVTTDTISRWENNRYPSIKRDNAEKLASALEVDLRDILRQEEVREIPDLVPATPSARTPRLILRGGLALLALLLVAIFVYKLRNNAPAPTAVRWVPKFAAPGEIIPVQVKVTRQPGETSGFILKEKLPGGLQLVSSLPASSATEPSGTGIKWLIPGGSASVTVSYTVRIPASPALEKEVKLDGEIVVRAGGANRTEAVAGNNSIRIGAHHWADANGDGRIDDDEIMPAYYIYEEMKGLGLDWKSIEAIWSGKGYRWESKSGFTVLK
ncbi:MAG: transcriptional regulator [Geobacteraceae bacterium GWC2_58_44]|nr:MAG: transcriptional regulator [Geobacteraceae bacterium GWC2_58_44]HBG07511.1 XRE family transcriptional regulator [Geobacter sp.]